VVFCFATVFFGCSESEVLHVSPHLADGFFLAPVSPENFTDRADDNSPPAGELDLILGVFAGGSDNGWILRHDGAGIVRILGKTHGKEIGTIFHFSNGEGENAWAGVSGGGYYAAFGRGSFLLSLSDGKNRRVLGELAETLHRPDLFMRDLGAAKAKIPGGLRKALAAGPEPRAGPGFTPRDSGQPVPDENTGLPQQGSLGVVLVSGESGAMTEFERFFLRQESGSLYAGVGVQTVSGETVLKKGLTQALMDVSVDTHVILIQADLSIDKSGEPVIRGGSDGKDFEVFRDPVKRITALARLRDRMPGAFIVSLSGRVEGSPAFGVEELLEPSDGEAGGGRYISAMDFARFIRRRDSGACFAGIDAAPDYPLLDTWLEMGALRISTLTPGAVFINGNEEEKTAVDFGEVVNKQLREGTYGVTMVYRNSHRETKTVEITNNSNTSIMFNYRPGLTRADFQKPLPAFGVFLQELNPASYKKIDVSLLEQLEIAPYYAAFLSGRKFAGDGSYGKAIAEYNRSVSLKNDYAEVYNYRGYAYSEQGDHVRAINDYSTAIRIRKDYADAYYNRGYSYSKIGDYDNAAADFSRVMELEPGNAEAYNSRGNAYYYKENDDRAIADYSRAIALKKDYALAYFNRGSAWYNKGDYEKAIADLSETIKLNPAYSRAYSLRASAFLNTGNAEKSALDFAAAGRLKE
jgi:Flp pilus assembly protein TadD